MVEFSITWHYLRKYFSWDTNAWGPGTHTWILFPWEVYVCVCLLHIAWCCKDLQLTVFFFFFLLSVGLESELTCSLIEFFRVGHILFSIDLQMPKPFSKLNCYTHTCFHFVCIFFFFGFCARGCSKHGY